MKALPDPVEQPTIDVPTAAQLLGIARGTAYRSIEDGSFPVAVLRLGRAIRVPTRPLLLALGLVDAGA